MEFTDNSFELLPLPAKRRIDAVCQDFETAWAVGRPPLEEYCTQVPDDERTVLFGELLHIEVESRRRAGESPRVEEYLARFPDHSGAIRLVLPEGSTDPAMIAWSDGTTTPEVPGYQVLEEIGRGGMGVVYKARHEKLNRLVALKFILSGPSAPPRQQDRFRREAELVALLRHPHITQIYDVGEAGGRVYLALEYAEGGSLRDRLDPDHPLEPRAAALLIEPLARAVQHAHRNGVVHRDIKPANILLTFGGDSIAAPGRLPSDFEPLPDQPPGSEPPLPLYTCTPKLTDFGLARLLQQDPPPGEPNLAAGTPSYMAPEQAMGAEPGPAVDIWALGATLYELVTGRPPFRADSAAETLRDVLMVEPLPASKLRPGLPRDLDVICLKCLQKDPEQRYPGARELAQDLQRFLAGGAIRARRPGTADRLARWVRKRPAMAATVAGLVLTAVAAVAALVGALLHARL